MTSNLATIVKNASTPWGLRAIAPGLFCITRHGEVYCLQCGPINQGIAVQLYTMLRDAHLKLREAA